MASIDVVAHSSPTVAAAGIVMRVVVTGSECTGKTTLAAALAEHYQTTAVGEFARQFVLEKGTAPHLRDVDAIASGQIAAEIAADNAAAVDTPVLILDTDLLSTVVYARHYYGDCPAWIEHALARRGADLYLLAGIDVPWVADGEQRDRAGRREEMQQLFRDALRERQSCFVEISGLPDDRLDAAIAAIAAAAR